MPLCTTKQTKKSQIVELPPTHGKENGGFLPASGSAVINTDKLGASPRKGVGRDGKTNN